ncbi:hypothetical protein [Oerskovia paurometabola]|uniref:hypothetical protein n=1 Tax=Oerskovia paurometabola TaxID=162170 RepID=UPI003418ECB0
MTELTLHDDAKRRMVRTNLMLIGILAPLLGLNAVTLAITTRSIALPLVFLGLVLAMIPLTYALARQVADKSRVTFGDGTLTVQGWGRSKTFTVEDMERVVTIDSMGFAGAAPTHHLVVVGPRKRLLLLVGQMWDREQLSALALDLAGRGVPLTPTQLRALDPRLVPWRQAHPVAVSLLVGLGVLLVLVTLFVVVVAILV